MTYDQAGAVVVQILALLLIAGIAWLEDNGAN